MSVRGEGKMQNPKHLVITDIKSILCDEDAWQTVGLPSRSMSSLFNDHQLDQSPVLRGRYRGSCTHSGHLADETADVLIAEALEDIPFHWVHSLVKAIKTPLTTVWRDLHSGKYIVRNLAIVSHTLFADQRVPRVESAIELQKSPYQPNIGVGDIL
jgi:hypothetical protein